MPTALRSLALLTPLLLAAPAGASPAREAGLREEITVQLVNVDVHVVGRDGQPVTGLDRDDFQLFDGGRPTAITHFAWIPAAAGGAVGGREADAAVPPRHIAIFFDELQISNRSRIPVLRALANQLVGALGPDDEVSIVRYGGGQIELVLPWTSDRKKMERALGELGAFSVRQLAANQDLATYMGLLQEDIKGGVAKKQTGGCPNAGVLIRSYADLVRQNVRSSADALLLYAKRLANEPGPRLLVHVSDGIPLVAGAEAYEYAIEMCGGDAISQGVPGAFSVLHAQGGERSRFDPFKARLEMTEYQMAPLWRDVAAHINAMGITVDAVQSTDPAEQFLPKSELGIVPPSVESLAEQNPVDTLALLAAETGGLLVRADRGAESEIARMASDLGGYYSLAFTPAAVGAAGVRSIRVALTRPGFELRYRKTYRLESREERIAGQLTELFDAEHADNPLDVVLGFPAPADADRQRVSVRVPMDGLTLIDGAEGGKSGLVVIYVTLREGSRVFAPRRQEVPIRVAVAGEQPFYTYEVDLPRGAEEVGVAVSDELSGEVSFARARLPGAPRSR